MTRGHKRYHRTKYEFTVVNPAGEILFTLWTVSKALSPLVRFLLADNHAVLSAIAKATDTQAEDWKITRGGIECETLRGQWTGRTLLEVKGYAPEAQTE